jgi:uncharacterized Fe-S radical SAM superfamily protein PflX
MNIQNIKNMNDGDLELLIKALVKYCDMADVYHELLDWVSEEKADEILAYVKM